MPTPPTNSAAQTPDRLFAFLDGLGIAHKTVTHPPVFTVEESQALRGQLPGGHTKNLFLRDKKQALYFVVACEDALIDLKGLHRLLGASGRFSFGSADLMREVLGVEPGSVTPFAAINDTAGRITVVLDADMMEARDAELSPAHQHHDDGDFTRRSGQISRGHRPPAPHRAGLRPQCPNPKSASFRSILQSGLRIRRTLASL